MLGEELVEGAGDGVREGGGAASAKVYVGADQLRGGSEGVIVPFGEEVHEVEALGGAAEGAGAHGDMVAEADLGQVAGVLLEGEAAAAGICVVVGVHAEHGEEGEGALVEEVGVPHDIHMAHDVEVFLGDGGPVGDREWGEVHNAEL